MGLFDNVHFSMDCPVCGTQVDDFQAKDGCCDGSTIEPDETSCFYSSCSSCDNWIEFTRPQPPSERKELSIKDVLAMGFAMTVAKSRKLAQKQ